MIKKKGFTIIEMVLITVIIGIIIIMMKPFFENRKRDYIYIESCINKIYGDMNNFMYTAASSKAIGTGINKVFPEQYIISVENSNTITLKYKDSTGTTYTQLTNYLTGMKEFYCQSNNYTSKFSGNLFTLTIDKKQSTKNANMQEYNLLGGSNLFTGSILILLCYPQNNCKEVGSIEIDTRIQALKKRKCLTINETLGNCIRRDQ